MQRLLIFSLLSLLLAADSQSPKGAHCDSPGHCSHRVLSPAGAELNNAFAQPNTLLHGY